MEAEEERNSIPPNPNPASSERENHSATPATATSTTACQPEDCAADEPECRTETERLSSESHEPPPGRGGDDSEAQPPASNNEVEETTVVDELEERVASVAERSEEELAGEPGGEEESRSVEGEPLPEVTVDERENQGGDVIVESGTSGGEKGSEEEVAVEEEGNPDLIGGEEESGGLAGNVDSPRKNDVEVAVKEGTEIGAAETQEMEEFVMVEKVEETENKDDTKEKLMDLVEGMANKDETENMQKEEAAGPPEDGTENTQQEDAAGPPEDEIENIPKEEGGGPPEAAFNRVSVDYVMEEMKGDEGKETTSAGRSTEVVDEMDDVEKEVEKDDVALYRDNKLNEGAEGVDPKMSEVAEEVQKLSEAEEEVAGEEKHEEMNEPDEQADKVHEAAEEENVTQPKEEEVEDKDEEMTDVLEEDEKVSEANKEEEDEKVSEADKEEEADEKLNEAEEEKEDEEGNEVDEKVNVADEEVDEEDNDNVNEANEEVDEEENEKVNEADEEEEEEEEEDDDDDEKMNEVEETVEEEGKEAAEEHNAEEVSKTGSGKRKRGNNAKAFGKAPSRKKVEEDVCFICFDGGELVLCDRRGCPKVYHPSCVNRDEAFFKSKGKWNCGWHICSNCEKNAYYMCYTCTFSLCKGCIKDGVIFCVRGNKGFCETCFKTVKMIEMNERGDKETTQVDFDDKSSWEYLFKDYWMDLKGRLSITSDELTTAKHPRKGPDLVAAKQESGDALYDAQNDGGSASDSSAGNGELRTPKGRKGKKRLKSRAKQKDTPSKKTVNGVGVEWASKELLEFIMHMKNGDRSVCSQFDVQALLLEYIKRNKLRDPRRKSQILCDSRLQHLFGKPRVGHFEMLKLLESHFLLKEDSQMDDVQGSVDNDANQMEGDGDALVKAGKDKKRKSRKKGDGRGLQSNVDDFGAIDIHNITLIYLKRSLVEELLDDTETFNEKVVGSFVRLRISGNSMKQDLYRLVQVIGTKKADNPYRVGKRTANFLLEILNLNKTEVISIDAISNQEFTEDECKRLRQSIKCGLLDRLTVGDIQEKAIALQAVRVQDILDSEITRLSHLRDRASDMGRRKELRECVEKLQLLKSPDERQRRLEEIPEIHVDPKMDPSYESEEEEDETADKIQVDNYRPRGSSGFSRRPREPISPRKGATNPNESWGGTRSFSSMNRELTRNSSSKGFSYKGDITIGTNDKANDNLWGRGGDREIHAHQSWESPRRASNVESRSSVNTDLAPRAAAQESSPLAPPAAGLAQQSDSAKINETQKIWHYKDPAGKIQGPFSMVQLRKWNNTGYFPNNLRIWRATEKEEDSMLLTDALDGNFQAPLVQSSSRLSAALARDNNDVNSSSSGRSVPTAVEIPSYAADRWNSETSLPSPTPASTGSRGGTRQARESRWSTTPAPAAAASQSNALANLSHVASPVARQASAIAQQLHSLTQVESPRVVQANPNHLHPVPNSGGAPPVVPAAMDTAALQSLVQTISNNPLLGGAQGNASIIRSGTGSQPWGGSGSMQSNNSSMPVASLGNNAYANWGNPQTVLQPSAQLGGQVQWGGMGIPIADNPGNQSMGWGGNLPPANTNHGWGIAHAPTNQVMIPGNANSNWMQGQQVVAGNTNAGWSPAVQVQGWGQGGAAAQPMNTTQNSGWVGPGNANNNHPSWERGSQGGDSGYGGGGRGGDIGDRQWNRQSSSRGPAPAYNRGQMVCKFFQENGHCRKGASCDYLHT